MTPTEKAKKRIADGMAMFGVLGGSFYGGKVQEAVREMEGDNLSTGHLGLIERFVTAALSAALRVDPARPNYIAIREAVERAEKLFDPEHTHYVIERDSGGEITLVVGPGTREQCVQKIVQIAAERHEETVTVQEVEMGKGFIGLQGSEFTIEIAGPVVGMGDPIPKITSVSPD